VIWGDRDPWLAPELADASAAGLATAELERVDAGHWPWLDRPEVVALVGEFLSG